MNIFNSIWYNNNMEQTLIYEAQAGNRDAFGLIVKQYSRRIYSVAYSFVRNMEDASDITQDVFTQAFTRFSTFSPERPLFPWLYQITKNLCLNRLVKRNREVTEENSFDLVPGRELSPEESLIKEASVLKLKEVLASLPETQREILILKEFDGCSYAEIAEILDIPVGTVMSRLFNARQKLKEAFVLSGGTA